VLAALGLVAFGLGYVGFAKLHPHGEPSYLVFWSLKLFFFAGPDDALIIPPSLDLARFLAVIVSICVGLSVVAALFRVARSAASVTSPGPDATYQALKKDSTSQTARAGGKLFVSYSRENRAQVEELVRRLPNLGFQAWVDSSLRGGQSWWERDSGADCRI
jgi:hypothetical protein